jgi:hypothetical protein
MLENIDDYWSWRINQLGWKLLNFTNKKDMMSWDVYEEHLGNLKLNLENKAMPTGGDLTTYYSWKNQPFAKLEILPSESEMKEYFGNMLRYRFKKDIIN